MKVFLLLFTIWINFILLVNPAFASTATPTPIDYRLPYPGILPDHPLYPAKRIRDWLLITFTRNPIKRIELKLLFADKKLVMGQFLLDKRNTRLSVDAIFESQRDLLDSAAKLTSLKKSVNLPVGLPDKIALAIKKHQEIIANISSSYSDLEQKEKLQQALNLNNQANIQVQSVK